MNDLSKIALIIAIAVGIFLYINLLCALIAWWSGWRTLAARFRHDFDFRDQLSGWQSARMRAGCHYNNALHIAVSGEGFFLSTIALVPRHPPLLIPWSEIKLLKQSKFFAWTYFTLQLGTEEQIPFTISERLFQQINQKHPLDASALLRS